MHEIREKDWKAYKRLREFAQERLAQGIMEESEEICSLGDRAAPSLDLKGLWRICGSRSGSWSRFLVR